MILIKLRVYFLCCQQGHRARECPVKERLGVRSRTPGKERKELGRID